MRTTRGRMRRRRAPGLAPLELVLWLPVLLLAMAMMVNYGTSVAWRVRGEIVAREAVWRERSPRGAGGEPYPDAPAWPVGAAAGVNGAAPWQAIDHPFIQHPVARGPLPNGFVVRDTLSPLKGSRAGSAEINRPFPLLSRLGRYRSGTISDPLLENMFTCGEMGIPNWTRRLPHIYQLPTVDPGYGEAYKNAILSIFQMTHYFGLRVLDRDVDWIEYRGSAPDFHPRIPGGMCELDRTIVQQQAVDRIVDVRLPNGRWQLGAISHLPRTLTNAFLNMYKATKASFEAELMSDPPPPPGRINYLNTHIQILAQKIALLEKFQPEIGPFEMSLATRP